MPRASRFKLDKKKLEEIREHFSYLISSLNNSEEIENFFDNFLTEEEKVMLTKRLVLFMMLKRDYPPLSIMTALNLSHETVRIYMEKLPLKDEKFQKTIERLVKREKTKEFWQKIDKILEPLDLMLRAKTDMKARAKLMTPGEDWPE